MPPVTGPWTLQSLWSLAAPRQPGPPPGPPKPPLTIYPQAGPTEQMMHRAMRERGVTPEVWDLARSTNVRMMPVQDVGRGSANYQPGQNEIRMGYDTDYPISGDGMRNLFIHELRHRYQDDPAATDRVNLQDGPQNAQFMEDARRWAGSQDDYGSYVRDMLNHQRNSALYGEASAPETDAYILMNPTISQERMPPYMKKWYGGWWNPGAQPDPTALRESGWTTGPAITYEDGSVGREPLPRSYGPSRPPIYGPPPAPIQPHPTWIENRLDQWRLQAGPDSSGNWG